MAKDLCGVDVRCDLSSRGGSAQHPLSLLNVVTLINKHPDGAIHHRQVDEPSKAGYRRDRWKIVIEFDRTALTVDASASTIREIRRRRLLLNVDTAEDVAQIGGEIGERARSDGEEDDAAFPIDRL